MLGIHRKVPKIEPKPKLLSEAVLSDAVGPLLGCEYPGEWLWATPRSGLTLLLGEPEVPWK